MAGMEMAMEIGGGVCPWIQWIQWLSEGEWGRVGDTCIIVWPHCKYSCVIELIYLSIFCFRPTRSMSKHLVLQTQTIERWKNV